MSGSLIDSTDPLFKRITQIVVRLRIDRFDSQRLFIMGDRFGETVHLEKNIPEVIMQFSVFRLTTQGGLTLFHCLGKTSESGLSHAKIGMPIHKIRVKAQSFFVLDHRLRYSVSFS